jgi:hypothetical protein
MGFSRLKWGSLGWEFLTSTGVHLTGILTPKGGFIQVGFFTPKRGWLGWDRTPGKGLG